MGSCIQNNVLTTNLLLEISIKIKLTGFTRAISVDRRHTGNLAVTIQLPCTCEGGETQNNLAGRGTMLSPVNIQSGKPWEPMTGIQILR